MLFKALLYLVAATNVVRADSSHQLHYKKVDAHAARGVAAIKGHAIAAAGAGLSADQGFWFSHFTIGGSPDLEILVDTGSSDTILNPNIYKPSSASVNTRKPFHISYATTNPDGSGSLSASGKIFEDIISQHDANLTVTKQSLGAITSPVSQPTFPHDGLIGYAGSDNSALNASPFIQSLCDQNTLSSCRFGLALNTDQTGALYYGSVATDQFTGSLVTVKIQDEWAVTGDITVNGKTIQTGASIITDSGTTVIFGPVDQVSQLFNAADIQAVQTSNGFTGYYNCSAPPQIGLSFGGTNFNVLASALAFAKDGDNCTATVHGSDAFGDSWLVGQAFFQGKYIDHNIDAGTMGFANLKSS